MFNVSLLRSLYEKPLLKNLVLAHMAFLPTSLKCLGHESLVGADVAGLQLLAKSGQHIEGHALHRCASQVQRASGIQASPHRNLHASCFFFSAFFLQLLSQGASRHCAR
jgi:hypothetical protein